MREKEKRRKYKVERRWEDMRRGREEGETKNERKEKERALWPIILV